MQRVAKTTSVNRWVAGSNPARGATSSQADSPRSAVLNHSRNMHLGINLGITARGRLCLLHGHARRRWASGPCFQQRRNRAAGPCKGRMWASEVSRPLFQIVDSSLVCILYQEERPSGSEVGRRADLPTREVLMNASASAEDGLDHGDGARGRHDAVEAKARSGE